MKDVAGPEFAVPQEQARQIGEADVASFEGCLGQRRSLRDRPRKGRLVELCAAKARIEGIEIVEIAALERARREIALGDLDRMKIAKGKGVALLLVGIEPGAACEARLGKLSAGKAHGLEPAIGKRGF